MPITEDFSTLTLFEQHYADLKADHWRAPAFESRPKAQARVLAIAREYGQGKTWAEQIERYLEDFRLALAAARGLPLLDARTTCWKVSGPAFVRRMAGSYRLDMPRTDEGDWARVQWLKLSDETAADAWLQAREEGTTVARVLARIVEAHYRDGGQS